MPTYRVILAVVISSFLALSVISCDREKPSGTTGEKKVDQTTPQPTPQTAPPTSPQTTPQTGQGTGSPGSGGTGQKTQ